MKLIEDRVPKPVDDDGLPSCDRTCTYWFTKPWLDGPHCELTDSAVDDVCHPAVRIMARDLQGYMADVNRLSADLEAARRENDNLLERCLHAEGLVVRLRRDLDFAHDVAYPSAEDEQT